MSSVQKPRKASMPPGLANSRWAQPTQSKTISSRPRTPPRVGVGAGVGVSVGVVNSAQPTVPDPDSLAPHDKEPAARPGSAVGKHNLARYDKIMRRMKWKGQFLDAGYRLAVARSPSSGGDPGRAAEAELMFKLDFHEYYMLVERALVHLLGVFGMVVSREFPPGTKNDGDGDGDGDGNGSGKMANNLEASIHNPLARRRPLTRDGETPRFAHAYHANVLHAFENPENPLHEALGTGEVRHQLWRAKELRNRWKRADEEDGRHDDVVGMADDREGRGGFVAAPLETYSLSKILTTIFAGLDTAYVVAREHVYGKARLLDWDEQMGELEESDNKWEFMVDAMDWEAV